MLCLLLGIFSRIVSNSYLNAFQKKLTNNGEKSSVINFYTYLGITLLCLPFIPKITLYPQLLKNIAIMGILGALGNYSIIKALSVGELSSLAPINSYKPIVALLFGFLILKEIPSAIALLGIMLVISGTFLLLNKKLIYSKALLYRFLALIFSGTEAIFIKKVILLTDINSALFFWAFSGLIFSFILALKHSVKISKKDINLQIGLIILVYIMQYSTNYVFSKMNVSYALALFQLSTILSVLIGINVFNEKGLLRKIVASLIMISGAIVIILN